MPAGRLAPPRVVAAVYSAGTLAAARALAPAPAAPDWLELRVDHFHRRPQRLLPLAADSPRPFIVTVRHPAEGGAEGTPGNAAARQGLYERFSTLPAAVAIDVEIRSLRELAALVRQGRQAKLCVVASCHDFRGVPSLACLRELAGRAQDAGADVFKLAATVATPGQLARLLDLMASPRPRGLDFAVMGMGPLGRVSRLALAAAGSVLNYGYLGEDGPQVSGQWPAATLRTRIDEILPTIPDLGPSSPRGKRRVNSPKPASPRG